ncbi:MAG TPA: hypothetical protein VMV07_03760 [Streptosporangiaceae bacterium]|nr:hypothetical protein [Streptosporangiaceae bacterium]
MAPLVCPFRSFVAPAAARIAVASTRLAKACSSIAPAYREYKLPPAIAGPAPPRQPGPGWCRQRAPCGG